MTRGSSWGNMMAAERWAWQPNTHLPQMATLLETGVFFLHLVHNECIPMLSQCRYSSRSSIGVALYKSSCHLVSSTLDQWPTSHLYLGRLINQCRVNFQESPTSRQTRIRHVVFSAARHVFCDRQERLKFECHCFPQ